MGQDILQLPVDLQVGAAVLGAFEGADARRDGGIGVRPGRGHHAGRESGTVAAAVVCVQQQAGIQKLGFLMGKLLVRAVGAQDVLCGAVAGLGQMEEHTLLVVEPALHLVGVDHHGGHTADQGDALVQQVLQAQVLRVLVVGVHAQHTALHLVHDVGRGCVHGVHEAVGQGPVLGQDVAERVQLRLGGQAAEQQQPDHFFKDEAVVAVGFVHDLIDVHPAVDQPTGGWG